MCDSGWASDTDCVSRSLLWVMLLLLRGLTDCGCGKNNTNRLWMTHTTLTDCGCGTNNTNRLWIRHKHCAPSEKLHIYCTLHTIKKTLRISRSIGTNTYSNLKCTVYDKLLKPRQSFLITLYYLLPTYLGRYFLNMAVYCSLSIFL